MILRVFLLITALLISANSMAAEGDMRFDPDNRTGNDGFIQVQDGAGNWGYVCDDYIENAGTRNTNAMIVAAAYFGATSCETSTSYRIGGVNQYTGTENFLFDDLDCDGTESNWLQCAHTQLGVDNCSNIETFGISCAGIIEPTPASVPTMSVWGLGLLASLLGLTGFVRRRRRKA